MRKIRVGLLLGGAALIFGLAALNNLYFRSPVAPTSQTETLEKPKPETLGEKKIKVSYEGEEGVDAFTLLKRNNEIKYDEYDFGKLVTEINGVENTKDKFWLLYINDVLATVGADSYITKDSDIIEWRYEEMK